MIIQIQPWIDDSELLELKKVIDSTFVTESSATELFENMTIDYTYNGPVDSSGKKLAEIDFEGKAETSGEGLVSFKDSKMTGTLLFDPKLGMLIKSETKMEMTMSIGGAAGAEMDTTMISKYNLISVE